jgi:hypothetical protein
MIELLNSAEGRFFEVLFFPFRNLDRWFGMAAVSLLTSVLVLLVYRWSSNQEGIRSAKNRTVAHLLELALFRNSLPVMFRAQREILASNLNYLRYSLFPLMILAAPLLVMIFQLELWFGYRPLKVGESAIVRVLLKENASLHTLSLPQDPGAAVAVETPPLRIEKSREVDWRIRAIKPGAWNIHILAGDAATSKQVLVGEALLAKVSPARVSTRWLDLLSSPGEPPLPDSSPIHRIEIQYPQAAFFGGRIHWLFVYFFLTLLFAYGLKAPLKISL